MTEKMTIAERANQSPVWDMSQERVLMATFVSQRFHFFMLFFTLVIGGAANAKHHGWQTFMLSFGSLVAILLTQPLYQVHVRNRIILSILREDDQHPYTIAYHRAGRMGRTFEIIPVFIPTICCFVLVCGAILSAIGII